MWGSRVRWANDKPPGGRDGVEMLALKIRVTFEHREQQQRLKGRAKVAFALLVHLHRAMQPLDKSAFPPTFGRKPVRSPLWTWSRDIGSLSMRRLIDKRTSSG